MDVGKFVNQVSAVFQVSICSAYQWGKNISNKFSGVVSNGATAGNNGAKWPCGLVDLRQTVKFRNFGSGGIESTISLNVNGTTVSKRL